VLLLCVLPVRAVDGDWGLGALEEDTPAAAREFLGEATSDEDAQTLFSGIFYAAGEKLRERVREELRFCVVLFSVVTISSVAELGDVSGRAQRAIRLASVLAVASSGVTEMNSFTAEALATLQELSDYSRSLLLVMAGSASLSGAVAGSAARCAATALVMDLLLSVGTGLIAPAVCGYTALSISDAAVGNKALRSAAGLMQTLCTLSLSALALGFTFWLGVISSLSGSAEAAGVKLTRTLLSNGLPLVGKLVSDAAASLSAAAGLVRATAGVFGLAVVLSLCMGSFLRLGCRYLAFRLTAVLCRCCSETPLSALLEDLASAYAMLLSLLGTGALCVFMAVWSLMRMSL